MNIKLHTYTSLSTQYKSKKVILTLQLLKHNYYLKFFMYILTILKVLEKLMAHKICDFKLLNLLVFCTCIHIILIESSTFFNTKIKKKKKIWHKILYLYNIMYYFDKRLPVLYLVQFPTVQRSIDTLPKNYYFFKCKLYQ